MVRDYLDWAAEQVGIAKLVAYILPVIAAVSLVGGVFAFMTKEDDGGGGGGGGLVAGNPTVAATRPPAQPTQPGQINPTLPPPPPGTPLPPGSPVAGTPGPAGTAPAGTPRPPGTPGPGTTPAPGGTPGAPAGGTYTVVSGDTGFGIAGKLNIPAAQQATWLADVARLNNMPNLNSLSVGQVLRLPPAAPAPAPAAPGGSPPAATPRP